MSDACTLSQVEVGTDGRTVDFRLDVDADIVFDLDVQIQVVDGESGAEIASHHVRQASWDIAWLPRCSVQVTAVLPQPVGTAQGIRVQVFVWSGNGADARILARHASPVLHGLPQASSPARGTPSWSLAPLEDSVALDRLSWNRGADNWFYRHFDHASRVIVDLMFANDPLLKGRVLDVGCGDGITDLGVYLRCRPREMIGIDPSRRYALLPQAAMEHGIPAALLEQPGLRFEPQDANRLDFPDDHFDAVISWGSLEHIVGGHARALQEIRRVLKPDGLFFCHPGLLYGCVGNHLGEFFDDPWIHLKLDPEELRRRVLAADPERMDRAGEVATPEQYWQWYTELNPITVGSFEQELRALGFEPWRVAVRSCDLVEYTPRLQAHSFTDLATSELYLSAWNRK